MQRISSAIFGLELSTWGKLFNTKAIISFRKEYELEEDEKVPSYTKNGEKTEKQSGDGNRFTHIHDAHYEMMDEQPTDIPLIRETNKNLHSVYKTSSNKYLNTYLQIQQALHPARGNSLDFRI